MQQPLSTISPLQRQTLFEALASEVEEWILSGQLEPGAKLPSEEALRLRFGVSRPVVREAFAQLRERGLIETINGSGTFVRHPDADLLTDALVRHLRVAGRRGDSAVGESVVGKVYEARIAIEASTARLAAQRATEQDLEAISARLMEMRSERSDLDAWTRADLGFHLAVASASHNPFLLTLLAPLVKVIERVIVAGYRSPRAVEAGLAAHERIWETVSSRDADGAETAMREHLADSQRRLSWTRKHASAGV
jgi:DNA-binding FadR family transcriptional regulator